MSFARRGRSQVQSFPRKRESTPPAMGNAPPTDWIPAPRLRGDKLRGNDECFERDPIPNDPSTRQSEPALTQEATGGFEFSTTLIERRCTGCGKTRPRRGSGDFTSPHVLFFQRQHGDVKSLLHVFPQPVQSATPSFETASYSLASGLTPSQGWTCQISEAYSLMVRSEENFPARATFRIALRSQPSTSR